MSKREEEKRRKGNKQKRREVKGKRRERYRKEKKRKRTRREEKRQERQHGERKRKVNDQILRTRRIFSYQIRRNSLHKEDQKATNFPNKEIIVSLVPLFFFTFSFGIILWEIVSLREPFEQFNDFPSFKRAITQDDVRYDTCYLKLLFLFFFFLKRVSPFFQTPYS